MALLPTDRPRRVWQGVDAYVRVFVIDKDNNRLDWANVGNPNVPVVDYCYWQNCSLSSQVPYLRRPVTGRSTKRVLRDIDEWSFSVEHLYLKWYYEFDPLQLFDRNNRLELNLLLQKIEDSNEIEELQLIPAYRTGMTLSSSENGVFIGSGNFVAENLFRRR